MGWETSNGILENKVNFIIVLLRIHPFPQFHPAFKKWQFLGFHLGRFPSFRIPPGIRFVFLDIKRTQSTDFNPVTFCKRVGHFIKKQVYNFH